MQQKTKIIICVVVLAVTFALGRYTVPTKIKIVTQTVTVDKKTNNTNTNEKQHQKTTVTETDKPDGTKVVTTVTTEDSDTDSKTAETDVNKSDAQTSKEISRETPLNVSFLVGNNLPFTGGSGNMVYGVSVEKALIGPVTTGLWGTNNGNIGFSVGLNF